MKSAFKRELFVLKHNLFYIIYILCFAVVAVLENCIDNEGTFFFTMLVILITCLYSANTFTNETKFKFDKQVTAFPETPWQIVCSKYIVAWGYSFLASTALVLIKQLLFMARISEENILPLISFLLGFYGICLAIMGLNFVINFAFGTEKAMWIMVALFAGFAGTIGFISGLSDEESLQVFLFWANNFRMEYIFINIAGGLIYLLSLPLSIKLYTRRIQK